MLQSILSLSKHNFVTPGLVTIIEATNEVQTTTAARLDSNLSHDHLRRRVDLIDNLPLLLWHLLLFETREKLRNDGYFESETSKGPND